MVIQAIISLEFFTTLPCVCSMDVSMLKPFITVAKIAANRNVGKGLVILTGILDNQMAGLHNMESALQKETNGTTAMAVLKLGLPQPMPISVKNQFEKELKRITESVCSSCKVEINTYLIQKYLLTLYKS